MLHHLKLKTYQSDDEKSITSNTFVTHERASLPPFVPPASSTSSLSSSEADQALLMSSLNNPTGTNNLVSELKGDLATLTGCIVVTGNTSKLASASISVISNNSVGGKRKAEDLNLEQSDSVPSVVSILSSQSHLSNPQQKHKKARTVSICNVPTNGGDGNSMLLSQPEDSLYLNPLHCFVRKNIEYFVATAKDIAAPCPGRKNSVTIGQVGLRCIHCRNIYSRNRTKRAVCYPSSVSRVYHCVSDMKFDHFSTCKFLPTEERAVFDQLKASCASKKRGKKIGVGSCNTARYYHDSAVKLGMVDGPQKGFVTLSLPVNTTIQNELAQGTINVTPKAKKDSSIRKDSLESINLNQLKSSPQPQVSSITASPRLSTSPQPPLPNLGPKEILLKPDILNAEKNNDKETFQCRLLAAPNDESVLAPIHCFVRKNVEIFAATAEDVAAPAPGRKTRVTVGQIGIRCIHCTKLSPKERIKRAICYPPSISSIYHTVSNMKFDHFGACRGISMDLKQEFASLRQPTGKNVGKKVNSKTTAQYYIDSAFQDLNLVDSPTGIRAGPIDSGSTILSARNSPTMSFSFSFPTYPSVSDRFTMMDQELRQSPTNGMSVLMMAATDPTMREAYEKRKAMMMGLGALSTEPIMPV